MQDINEPMKLKNKIEITGKDSKGNNVIMFLNKGTVVQVLEAVSYFPPRVLIEANDVKCVIRSNNLELIY